jgi:hypothetical protein
MPLTPSAQDKNRKAEIARRKEEPDSFNDRSHNASSADAKPAARRRSGSE